MKSSFCTRYDFFQYFLACSCSDYINENGIGNCTKRISLFNWKYICYVNQPSSCSDLMDSGTNVGKQISGEACGHKNSG